MPDFEATQSQLAILRAVAIEGHTVAELSTTLSVTPTAVRQHIRVLEAAGLVTAERRRATRGRPSAVYAATTKALHLFPKRYDLLAETMVSETESGTDPQELDRVADSIALRIIRMLRQNEPQRGDFDERLTETVSLLSELDMDPVVAENGRGLKITLHNCPYYEVSLRHASLMCEISRRLIQRMLRVEVAKVQTIAEGHSNCVLAAKRLS
ncbi:MAG: helix-turn-helix transcriptional regulator, partial [Candidatus Geothermarchaeales archaeon]